MIQVFLIGHGRFPAGLRDAAELIVGHSERLRSFGLAEDDSPDGLRDGVAAALDDDGALLLVDIHGGTPSNVAFSLAARDPRVQVVVGMNLPMLLEVLTSPATNAAELVAVAIKAGRAGVTDDATWKPYGENCIGD